MTPRRPSRPLSRRIGGALLAIYQWPAFYLALALLGCIQLCWALGAFVLRYTLSEARGRHIGRLFISIVFRRYFLLTGWLGLLRVDAAELDAIDTHEAMIIAANHPSVIDALILISRLENLNCIMKASVLDNVLLGAGARLAGYIRNDGPKRMLRLSAEDLKNGGQLIIFPEGTRTLAAPVNEFKCGFAAMARIAQVPVQTVIIETDSPYVSKGWSVLKKPPCLPMTFRARLGKRFEVDREVNSFVDDLHGYFVKELSGAQLGDLWKTERAQSSHERRIDARLAPAGLPVRGEPLPLHTSSIGLEAANAPFHAGVRSLQR
ncbi:MAG: lysophospholipid acyltransferase family protein [Burkholderiaceae bacterium]